MGSVGAIPSSLDCLFWLCEGFGGHYSCLGYFLGLPLDFYNSTSLEAIDNRLRKILFSWNLIGNPKLTGGGIGSW